MLVAISIPIFTTQLEKSRESTDQANLRAAYAECSTAALSETTAGTVGNVTVTVDSTTKVVTCTATVPLKQQKANWESSAEPEIGGVTLGNTIALSDVTVTVSSDGAVSFKQGSTDLKKV